MSELTEADITTGTELVYQGPSVDFTNDRDYRPAVRGTVVDIAEETKHLVSDTIEQTIVVIETEDNGEKRVNIDNLVGETDFRVGVVGEDADGDGQDDDDGEAELVADGGEDVTKHVDDETIRRAIESNDDPDHPDALTVDDVRELLACVQRGAEVGWGTYMDNVEDGDAEVIAEDDDTIVLSTGDHNGTSEELELAYEGDIEVDGIAKTIVTQIHHELANERCDRDWGVSYPFVVAKPDGFDDGQRYVEAVVNGLQQRGLSPGQAWAYYGVEIRGNSRNSWGHRKGDHDHKNVSDALEKAKQKLP